MRKTNRISLVRSEPEKKPALKSLAAILAEPIAVPLGVLSDLVSAVGEVATELEVELYAENLLEVAPWARLVAKLRAARAGLWLALDTVPANQGVSR